jgi:hypothetical protein
MGLLVKGGARLGVLGFIALAKREFWMAGAVLADDTGDEGLGRSFHGFTTKIRSMIVLFFMLGCHLFCRHEASSPVTSLG